MEQQEAKKQAIKIITHALLVEDYIPCQKFMTVYLNQLGYQVDATVDSATTIQNIQHKAYDLIIGDLNLKGCLSAKKVIQMVRESKLNIGTSVIVWSAYVNERDKEKYLLWSADRALIKACSRESLERAIYLCVINAKIQKKILL